MRKQFRSSAAVCVAVVLFAVTQASSAQVVEWAHLFDGQSMRGWTNNQGNPVPGDSAWQVVDGAIHLDRSRGKGGNIFYQLPVGDFELVFEFKISSRGNNGIKYRVQQFGRRTLGCEYQIIDDLSLDKLKPRHKTAALYDVYETLEHDRIKPAGEFNRGAIIVRGNSIEHWLNGRLVVDARVGSAEWNKRIAESKFNDVEGFGVNRNGRIMLTDHGDQVWFRNLFLRRL